MPWKLIQDSFSVCRAYFADGNKRTFYSIDWTHQYTKTRDRNLGLNRLRKRIHVWGARATMVIIYDRETNTEIERYEEGIKSN